MGKQTLYHPVSLHVLRGAAEYCGYRFGKVQQTVSDPTGLSATYSVEIVLEPRRCEGKSLEWIRHDLQDCFNADIRVVALIAQTGKNLRAVIRTCIIKDTEPQKLPDPERLSELYQSGEDA